MSIRQVLEELLGHVLQHLYEHLIISENFLPERQKVNIYDSPRVISLSTPTSEHAKHVTAMDIKK